MSNQLHVIKIGTLKILDTEIPCAVLEGEKRVLVQREVVGLLTGNKKGGLGRYLDAGNLQRFLPEKFKNIPLDQAVYSFKISGRTAQGFEAEDIIGICEMYLKARDAGVKWSTGQENLAKRAEILMRSFAKIGLVALIDEATGYQIDRDKNALRLLVEQYIIEDARAWTKEFYDQFFIELDRIYGNQRTISRKRPQYYGTFINNYIYKPIENGLIYEKIDGLNPKTHRGNRRYRIHQFLTEEKGLRTLRDRISKITGVLQVSTNMRKFKEHYSMMESKQLWFRWPEE